MAKLQRAQTLSIMLICMFNIAVSIVEQILDLRIVGLIRMQLTLLAATVQYQA